jgi:hypothetical protein
MQDHIVATIQFSKIGMFALRVTLYAATIFESFIPIDDLVSRENFANNILDICEKIINRSIRIRI